MVNTKDINWEILQENVRIKTLARDKARGLQISIMNLGKNVKRPHIHPDIEWVYVLRGSFSDENGRYEQGYFLANEKGSKHTLIVGQDGCELILVWSGSVKMICDEE
ncbi:MAG: cupin domain-containing protein [Candidatus Woesearchaeota archaeon]